MARSQGYRFFKTDNIEDMSFEQLKVLIYATAKINREMAAATEEATLASTRPSNATTHRIIEES